MKKSIIIAVSAAMMVSIAATNAESPCMVAAVNQTASIESNNPIEKAFAKDFNSLITAWKTRVKKL